MILSRYVGDFVFMSEQFLSPDPWSHISLRSSSWSVNTDHPPPSSAEHCSTPFMHIHDMLLWHIDSFTVNLSLMNRLLIIDKKGHPVLSALEAFVNYPQYLIFKVCCSCNINLFSVFLTKYIYNLPIMLLALNT